jgi:hypothetical protein
MDPKLQKTLDKATKVLLKRIKSKGYIPITPEIASEYVPVLKFTNTGPHHHKFIIGLSSVTLMNNTPMINNVKTMESIGNKDIEEIKTNWEKVHIRTFTAFNKDGSYNPFHFSGLSINYQIISIDPSNKSEDTAYIKRSIGDYVSSDTLNIFKDLYDIE